MENLYLYMDKIQNEEEYLESSQRLRILYKEIIRLIIKKEKYEKMIEEYLRTRES
jgi:hypothetical protein